MRMAILGIIPCALFPPQHALHEIVGDSIWVKIIVRQRFPLRTDRLWLE